MASGQYGSFPAACGLAKTQSPWLGNIDFDFQFKRTTANSGDIGSGRLEAKVLGGPSTWSTIERTTRISSFSKIDILPLQTEQLATAKTRNGCCKDDGTDWLSQL